MICFANSSNNAISSFCLSGAKFLPILAFISREFGPVGCGKTINLLISRSLKTSNNELGEI